MARQRPLGCIVSQPAAHAKVPMWCVWHSDVIHTSVVLGSVLTHVSSGGVSRAFQHAQLDARDASRGLPAGACQGEPTFPGFQVPVSECGMRGGVRRETSDAHQHTRDTRQHTPATLIIYPPSTPNAQLEAQATWRQLPRNRASSVDTRTTPHTGRIAPPLRSSLAGWQKSLPVRPDRVSCAFAPRCGARHTPWSSYTGRACGPASQQSSLPRRRRDCSTRSAR